MGQAHAEQVGPLFEFPITLQRLNNFLNISHILKVLGLRPSTIEAPVGVSEGTTNETADTAAAVPDDDTAAVDNVKTEQEKAPTASKNSTKSNKKKK